MARKSLADLYPHKEALDEFVAVSLVKYEMAEEVYDAQDDETRTAINAIMGVLSTYATGNMTIKGESIKVPDTALQQNLLYLAVEVVKDLALLGIRVANFEFPKLCVTCGVEVG